MSLESFEKDGKRFYYLPPKVGSRPTGSKFIYKKNAFTNQMVPVGLGYEVEDGTTKLAIFYPENKSFNSCDFINLYTPEFYVYEEDRESISWSEYYSFDESYRELTNTKYFSFFIRQIFFNDYVVGYMQGAGVGVTNVMVWLYDQFLDKDSFNKQSEQSKNAATVKTIIANSLEKLL